VPQAAVVAESDDPADWDSFLWPGEEEYVARAVEQRRREFAAGRNLARAALAEIGIPPSAIGSGSARQPLWPSSVLGSITHTTTYCGAAVARVGDLECLGIDAEECRRLDERVLATVSLEDERRWLEEQDPDWWPVLLFSAKEAFYKAIWPVIGQWVGYQDVRVSFDSAGAYEVSQARSTAPAIPAGVQGRYAVDGSRVYTVAFR
jgi:4'-phosphopantetheinyl transferase EntD